VPRSRQNPRAAAAKYLLLWVISPRYHHQQEEQAMQERELKLMSGWPALAGWFLGLGLIVLLIVVAAQAKLPWLAWVIVPLAVAWLIAPLGFIVNSPNQSRVVQLFGAYVGTVRDTGFFYGSPLYWRKRVSLRVRTFETGSTRTADFKDANGIVIAKGSEHRQPSKVNDRNGTPIEVAAVVVWKVVNPADAVFQVDQYESFVRVQSEAALRNLAAARRPCATRCRAVAARQHGGDRRGIEAGIARAAAHRRRGGVRGADQLPGLRPGDRRGHAPAAAGRRHHRGPAADRRCGRGHGRARPGRAGQTARG
jgi:hypothetical protein